MTACYCERSSLPSKKFLCISMGMLQIGALSLVGRLVEARGCNLSLFQNRMANSAYIKTSNSKHIVVNLKTDESRSKMDY